MANAPSASKTKQISQQTKSRYRPEIDGLRGLALAAVVMNHFNKDLLPSGYLGVDIFFVISGYVITSSLEKRPAKNFLDFATGFYERRIKRLAPALVVFVLAASVMICLFNPEPNKELDFGWPSLFGFSNITLYQSSTDYFAESTELNPFTHTWSLSVEEQFYLLFPVLVWFSGFGRQSEQGAKNLFFWVGSLTIASLIGFITLYQIDQPAAYFLMLPRFWEMATGCLIFIGFQKRAKLEQTLEKIPPFMVIVAMASVMLLPNGAAVPATIGIVLLSAVLIACLKEGTAAHRVFTLRAVVFIGLISYSFYLWHWGVLCISRWTIGIHWWTTPFQIGAMLLLATGSYYWIETPFRRSNWSSRRWQTISSGLGASAVASVIVMGLGQPPEGKLYLGNKKATESLNTDEQQAEAISISYANCSEYNQIALANCSIPPMGKNRQKLLLMGDSHSSHYYPLLGRLRNQTGIGISGFVTSGQTFPASKYTDEARPRERWEKINSDSQKFFNKKFPELARGDLLVISSRLEYYFIRSKFNREHKNKRLKLADNNWQPINEDSALRNWVQEVRSISEKSKIKGVNIIVIAPTPVFRGSVPLQLCQNEWFRPTSPTPCAESYSTERSLLTSRFASINHSLDQLALQDPNIHIYRPFDILCPTQLKYCSAFLDGIRVFRDDDHLSRKGSLLVAEDFLAFLESKRLINPPIRTW